MKTQDQRIRDLIAASPEAEDVLEDAGIDYWFDWERPLRSTCQSAGVDADALATRLTACSTCPGEPPPADLAALLRQSDEQWNLQLEPRIAEASAAASRLRDSVGEVALALLDELRTGLAKHMSTSNSLLCSAKAISEHRTGLVSKETLRELRLEHLAFIRVASDLRCEAGRLANEDAGAKEVARALREVVRETHRHVKVAYNFILPLLVPAVARPPVGYEPW